MKKLLTLLALSACFMSIAQVEQTGSAVYGSWPANSSYSYFSHSSLNSANSNTNYALLQRSNGQTFLNSKSNMSIHLRLGNVDQMVFKSSGIGVGTNSPSAQFHLYGKGADFKIEDTPGGGDNSADIYLQNVDANDVVINKLNIFSEGTGSYFHAQGTDLSSTLMTFGVNWDHAITLRDGLMVGFGTDNPVEHFHVVDKAYFQDVVGIGTRNVPSGYSLAVSGGIIAEKVKVAVEGSSDWADYVFDEGYELMSIQELDTYITQNDHLPNIPSTQELQGQGLDLAEMQKLQMEKIEELTLYLIQLSKENEELRKTLHEVIISNK